jgi:thiol-disulfide isomerase/thioredoxin
MALATRRAAMAGAAVLAAATVAVATLWRKPEVFTPVSGPDEAHVDLQSMAALKLLDPPRAVPAITFTDADGTPYGLDKFAGRGVVLNLWATWCAPCVAELPSLAALARALGEAHVVVLPLSSDRGGAAVVRRFYEERGIVGLGVWLDPKGAAEGALKIRGVPTTLLIDAAGRERARLEGAADWAAPDAQATIRHLLG